MSAASTARKPATRRKEPRDDRSIFRDECRAVKTGVLSPFFIGNKHVDKRFATRYLSDKTFARRFWDRLDRADGFKKQQPL